MNKLNQLESYFTWVRSSTAKLSFRIFIKIIQFTLLS